MISTVLINGEVSDGRIPITDSSVLRGDGCFEVMKAYDGRPFALDPHLERLERSARQLRIQLPDRDVIRSWVNQIAKQQGNGAVRVVVTRGSSIPGDDAIPQIVVFGHAWERDAGPVRLFPVTAPWHGGGEPWELSGAKVLSYAPNMSATRKAREEGFDDALLVTVDGRVLEGPTFAVAWVIDGVLETPGLELGILDSITRRLVLAEAKALLTVVEGTWVLDRVALASEVMAMSTTREVQPVVAVGEVEYEPGPVTDRLHRAFVKLIS